MARCIEQLYDMPRLNHKDTIIFVEVNATGYGNKKLVIGQHDVKGTFLQNTGFLHTTNQDLLDADAILYPNERDEFIKNNHNRLEGMYIIAPLFGSSNDESWYKIETVTVNRDHLLSNKIDNILCTLKRAESLPGVS